MAESQNGTDPAVAAIAAAAKAERVLDLDAFAPPQPDRYMVLVRGVKYPVRQIMHLTGQEELDLDALDRRLDEATTNRDVRRAMFDRAYHQVRVLVPTMPEKVRLGLKYAEAIEIAREAWAYAIAENPPVADTGSSDPAENSKPVSVASTASIPAG